MLFFFALTLFTSATLLFFVQPMIGKMILPRLGGTPAVWNTCMVFFQAILLIGYGYTHTLSTWQSRRRQLLAQFAILGLPFLVLPFSLGNWNPRGDENPIVPLLWLLLGVVGLPFFVVATSAPLLQRWFTATGHPAGKDPYFLYGASNLGSMLALILYPVLVEPYFSLDTQAWLWTGGYALLVVMVGICGLLVWQVVDTRTQAPSRAREEDSEFAALSATQGSATVAARRLGRRRLSLTPTIAQAFVKTTAEPHFEEITWSRRLRWIALAAAPTSLMLGVTMYLTTDIAAIPFLWILPLALYLLTFILVFARWPVTWAGWPHTFLLYVQPICAIVLVAEIIAQMGVPVWGAFCIHLLAFLTTALVCHGELAKDRPAARHLTEFYFCMALGGVLGGLFNAMVAPQVFWFGVAEYYLALVVACCLRPLLIGDWPLIPGDSTRENATALGRTLDVALPACIGFAAYYAARTANRMESYWEIIPYLVIFTPLIVSLGFAGRPLRFGPALGCVIGGVDVYNRRHDSVLFEDRSFFGLVKVRQTRIVDEDHNITEYHTLIHGGINHGQQVVQPESRRRDTITYFHPTGGIGQVFKKFSWPDARLPASLAGLGAVPGGLWAGMHSEPPFAVVGLGTGILAAHAKPWQHVVFYEIDPLVKRLSLPPEGKEAYFYYLLDAQERGANLEVVLGDGRKTLEVDPAGRLLERYYHILVIDAFSSDAIPIHLLTAEAIDVYLDRLVEGGLLVFNVTNRYVNLVPVLSKISDERDLTCLYYGDYEKDDEGNKVPDKLGSDWVVIQRKEYATMRRAVNGGPPVEERLDLNRWKAPRIPDWPMWTDKYSNLLRVMHW